MSEIAVLGSVLERSANHDAPSGLDALLARLGTDGASAGLAYERLRRSLILVLRRHVPVDAEDFADTALERLARRIHEGTPIENPGLYALGIARNLVLEAQAGAQKMQRVIEDPTFFQREVDDDADGTDADATQMLAALSACLAILDAESRQLLLRYYGANGSLRIRDRQILAGQLGISVNALRNRALRLRKTLEDCARKRLAGVERRA